MNDVYRSLVDLRERAKEEVSKVVLGQDRAVELLLVAALARGHVLIEGPPGSAKTLLGRAIAHMLGASFNRIQFTPDTQPKELVGECVTRSGERVFEPGAVFTNVLLADEVNRTPPRNQSALLEAMQGAAGHGRGARPQAQRSVPRHRNAERERPRRRLPAARIAARSLPLQDPSRVCGCGFGARMLELPHDGLLPDMIADIHPLLGVVGLEKARYELNSTVLPTRSLVTSSPSAGARVSFPASSWERARAR